MSTPNRDVSRSDWQCLLGGQWDHDYIYKTDWTGDPGVIGGTYEFGWYECVNCGHEDNETEAPDPDHCSDALYEDRPPPHPDDDGPSAGLDHAKAGKWRG